MNVRASSDDVLNAAARHRRYGRIEVLFVACFVVLLMFATVIAWIAIDRQREIVVSGDQIECLLRLDAQFARAEADALSFVPGSPEREAASQRMRDVAEEFASGCSP